VADTINVTIRLDREVKERAESLFSDLGMNLSTAFNIFARQSLR
jgi:DNA-damage-inducible protein J